ncbi:MAG: hypothetical protein IT378_20510, partial [Sandaracinaceae bacterium]|nr:hypothetical protein [Sandaracinaceae bacterium]
MLVSAQGPGYVDPEATLERAAPEVTDSIYLDEIPDSIRDSVLEQDRSYDPNATPQTPTPEPDTNPEPISLPGSQSQSAVSPQAIQLPNAEGSIEGMGESFSPVLSSGTATFGVPIAVAPGRAGVQPSLSLSYATTGGNGPVGFGWGMGAPFIARQTDRGLPHYIDQAAWHPREDRFLYNGGQELVPVGSAQAAALDQTAAGTADASLTPADVAGWQQYRARVEGGFMRFFRAPDSTRWVVQSKDGTRFDFGLLPSGQGPTEMVTASAATLERDPDDDARIYRWCLTRMSDPHGSTVYYQYRQDRGLSYLEHIYYVSPATCAASTPDQTRQCTRPLTEYGARVRLVYEPRQDTFTSYASGWRIDTALRLRRVEVTAYHDPLGARALVRRYHLRYDPSSFHSLLTSVQVEGRAHSADATVGADVVTPPPLETALNDDLVGALLPPMSFRYSTMPATGDTVPGFGTVSGEVREVLSSPPHSVDEARADLFDVNSDGLPDLIVTDPARYRT